MNRHKNKADYICLIFMLLYLYLELPPLEHLADGTELEGCCFLNSEAAVGIPRAIVRVERFAHTARRVHLLPVDEKGIRHDGKEVVAERHSPEVRVAGRCHRNEARFELGTAEAQRHIRAAHSLHFIEFDEVVLRHALRPAMLPIFSYLVPAFVGIITGAIVIESVFGLVPRNM